MRQLSRSEIARDAWTNDVFLHGFLMMADVPKTQVFCPTERGEIQTSKSRYQPRGHPKRYRGHCVAPKSPSTPRKPVKKWNSRSQKGKWDPEILDKELNGSLWEFEDTPS
ncbi:hypothetical protein Hypma_000989 [Hypsizygus marmoreus]|uniref:Uncharacterized protein n=1 Tax=Hypsizygus marmoreus TaxID=39966 RepID=A0A369J8I5_HYPMA|nr:hypothetical protein Hypma_000989 [Hypsizygus marmoreus]